MRKLPIYAKRSVAQIALANFTLVAGGYLFYLRYGVRDRKDLGVPSDEYRENFFNSLAEKYDFTLEESSEVRELREILGKLLKRRCLEVGGGTGRDLEFLNPTLESLVVVEKSKNMISEYRKKLKNFDFKFEIDFVESDFHSLPFENNSFDCVFCTFSISASSRPLDLLKELRRVCQKDGRILILDHGISRNFLPRLLEKITLLTPDPEYVWTFGLFDDYDFIDLGRKSGFHVEVLQTRKMGHLYLLSMMKYKFFSEFMLRNIGTTVEDVRRIEKEQLAFIDRQLQSALKKAEAEYEQHLDLMKKQATAKKAEIEEVVKREMADECERLELAANYHELVLQQQSDTLKEELQKTARETLLMIEQTRVRRELEQSELDMKSLKLKSELG